MPILRQQIVDAVKARMALITVAHGYYTNIGAKVTEWKVTPFNENELDSVSVRDPADDPVDGSIMGGDTIQDRNLTVVISLPFHGGGASAAATMRKAIMDVYRAIGTETDGFPGETWGGLAFSTEDQGNQLDVDQEERKIMGVDITVKIRYRTTKWQES